MNTVRPWQSVVGRVVGVLLIGGLVVSIGMGVLEWRRSRANLQLDLTQDTTLTVRNLQHILRGLGTSADAITTQSVLSIFLNDDAHLRAARLIDPEGQGPSLGDWSALADTTPAIWEISEMGLTLRGRVALDRPTLIKAPFNHMGRATSLELLIDGPAALAAMRNDLYTRIGTMWLVLSVMLLMGLLLLRRWFISPLREVVELIAIDVGPEPFRRLAGRHPGEFGKLAGAIAQMLARLAAANQQLEQRQRAFASLYQLAPTAMLSLDEDGRITEANHRATELFEPGSPQGLLGRDAATLIEPDDRPLLQQTIDKLTWNDTASCELRVRANGQALDCNLEAMADRDQDGMLQSYRLSLTDVSRSRGLRRELEHQTLLLNLVLNHMSDAIVLVGADGRIAAYNQQLQGLLQHRADQLAGRPFDHTDFWDALGVLNREQFIARLRQIDAERDRPAQERFETRAGVFLFQGIPVHDVAGTPAGRLWVVQETTPQEHSQRLISQQNRQLQVLKDTGARLSDAIRVESLMHRAVELLYEGIGIEAVGVAIRTSDPDKRCAQIIHRGPGPYLLETNRRLAEAVACELMPRVLNSRDVALWTDLQVKTPWAEAARQAGLTCVAAVPLRGASDAQGIIWIARRAGERLERHHIMLIETIAPLLAARLQIAQLAENLQRSNLTDHITGLPSLEQLDHTLHQLSRKPGQSCAVVAIHLDHFCRVNDLLDHAGADAVLKRLADRVSASCRRDTFIYRESGPAFGIVVPGATTENAMTLAQRVSEALGQEQVTSPDGRGFVVTASVGIGACPADGRNPFDARDAALVRVELAKQQGRNRIVAKGPAHPLAAAG